MFPASTPSLLRFLFISPLILVLLIGAACGSPPPSPPAPSPAAVVSTPRAEPTVRSTVASPAMVDVEPTAPAGPTARPAHDSPSASATPPVPVSTVAPAIGPTLVLSRMSPDVSAPASAAVPLQQAKRGSRSEGSVTTMRGGPPVIPPEAGGQRNPNDAHLPLVYFEGTGVNPFIDADEDPLSTFSLDGDTASFEIGRLYLRDGVLPPPDSVRPEEWLNAFDHGYQPSEDGLALHLDGGTSLFGPDGYWMVRVGVSPAAAPAERDPVTVVFVLDTSGSMAADGRISVARSAIDGVVDLLDVRDRVALVTYGAEAIVALPVTDLQPALGSLAGLSEVEPGGSTYVEAGISSAYALAAAEQEAHPGRAVRIVLLSDGVGNVGATGPDSILATLDDGARRSVTLSSIGVGTSGNYNDVLLEALANRGNGTYHYVSSSAAVATLLTEHGASLLADVARDARVQVEFNPSVVRKYRLIGYENRAVQDSSFRDDTLDFGEIGFARPVVALYEVRPHADAPSADWIARARLRWRAPDSVEVHEIDAELGVASLALSSAELSDSFFQAQLVAETAELLRRSFWAQCSLLTDVSALLDTRTDVAALRDGALADLLAIAGPEFVPYCKG